MDMNKFNGFINDSISNFHQSRLNSLNKLKLTNVLKRKNLYLYKAKNIQTSEELIKSITDAYLSSQEETIFGEFLERLAIFVAQEVKDGFKSGIEGIDLEIIDDEIRYIISIKSGPNWGNSSQIKKMSDYFSKAKKILKTQNSSNLKQIIAINGCCYGKDNQTYKSTGDYYKLCGQAFWNFISGKENFYLSIIEPLGYKAKEKNEDFNIEYAKLINKFSREFLNTYFLDDGSIDWVKIVKLNSESKAKINQ
jgi:hypothetical protein